MFVFLFYGYNFIALQTRGEGVPYTLTKKKCTHRFETTIKYYFQSFFGGGGDLSRFTQF